MLIVLFWKSENRMKFLIKISDAFFTVCSLLLYMIYKLNVWFFTGENEVLSKVLNEYSCVTCVRQDQDDSSVRKNMNLLFGRSFSSFEIECLSASEALSTARAAGRIWRAVYPIEISLNWISLYRPRSVFTFLIFSWFFKTVLIFLILTKNPDIVLIFPKTSI